MRVDGAELLVYPRSTMQSSPYSDAVIYIEHHPDITRIHPLDVHQDSREMVFKLAAAIQPHTIHSP